MDFSCKRAYLVRVPLASAIGGSKKNRENRLSISSFLVEIIAGTGVFERASEVSTPSPTLLVFGLVAYVGFKLWLKPSTEESKRSIGLQGLPSCNTRVYLLSVAEKAVISSCGLVTERRGAGQSRSTVMQPLHEAISGICEYRESKVSACMVHL